MRMTCPHCGAKAFIRTSEIITNLLMRQYFVCSNHLCGHTFVAATEITHTLSPSATPNPYVLLPFSKHVNRATLARQLALARNAVEPGTPPPGQPLTPIDPLASPPAPTQSAPPGQAAAG